MVSDRFGDRCREPPVRGQRRADRSVVQRTAGAAVAAPGLSGGLHSRIAIAGRTRQREDELADVVQDRDRVDKVGADRGPADMHDDLPCAAHRDGVHSKHLQRERHAGARKEPGVRGACGDGQHALRIEDLDGLRYAEHSSRGARPAPGRGVCRCQDAGGQRHISLDRGDHRSHRRNRLLSRGQQTLTAIAQHGITIKRGERLPQPRLHASRTVSPATRGTLRRGDHAALFSRYFAKPKIAQWPAHAPNARRHRLKPVVSGRAIE
jgi:hypothetical protein